MSRTPRKLSGSQGYREAWRAVNLLIRTGGSWSGRERDVCYRNVGDGTFADESYLTGLDSAGDGRGLVALDLNGDGAMDLVEVSRTGPRVRVLRNRGGGDGALVIELRGAAGGRTNRDAIGAVAELTTSRGRKLVRQVEAGSGYLTQGTRRLHFGLPAGERPERLRVKWPGGGEQELGGLPGTGTVRLTEGAREVEEIRATPGRAEARGAGEKAASVWLVEPTPAPGLAGAVVPGRKTLVNFWASWCPPCREEMKEWATPAAVRRFAAAGVRVVVAAVEEEGGARPEGPFAVVKPTKEELAAWNLFHRHLYDYRRDIALPTSFLLDERGRVVKVYHGVTGSGTIAADAVLPAAGRRSLPFRGRWLGEAPRRNYVEMATALAEGGLAKEAARYFELAVGGGRASREALTNYAGVLLETGDLAKAEKLLTAAEGGVEALANLGMLRLRQGRYGEARAAFEKVLAGSPDDGMALNGLGSVLFAAGDVAGAKARFEEAVRVEPEHAGYRYNWASALAATGELAAALREFERVREGQGETAALCNNLGILYVETGAAGKGEAEFRRAIALAPKEEAGYLNLASLYQRGGRVAEARGVLGQMLQAIPGSAQGRRMLEGLR